DRRARAVPLTAPLRGARERPAAMSVRQGERWEDAAARYLERHGLEVLEKNYRCRVGELDLVCRDADAVVVVEVRARAASAPVDALESIGPRKRRRIVQATRHLLLTHARLRSRPVRFDVVAIDAIDSDNPRIQWIKNAFDAS